MSTKNRGDRIQLLHKVVTKHYTPVLPPEDRSVLEHLLYACCLEDAPHEAADEAFHRLQESFFDWNEVRVTTVSELCETLHNLPEPSAAALRIKKNLQSLFETRYSFDIDDMIKMNQGKAVQELEKLAGMTKFVLGYITQNALGGHAIPVSDSIMQILLATEIVSPGEAEKGQAPGLERTVAKSKGPAFASCLHQLAVEHATAPGGKQVKAVMKEAGATEPKKPVESKKPSEPKKESEPKKKEEKPAAAAKPSKDHPEAASQAGSGSKKSPPKSPPTDKATSKKPPEKTSDKPIAKGKSADNKSSDKTKTAAGSSSKPITKKPAKPATTPKPALKKPPTKSSPAKKTAKRKPR
jgi:endonuclease III